MRRFAIILLILLLVPSAYAAEKRVYASWHYFQDEFIFDDSVFTVRLNRNDWDELRLQRDGESMVIYLDADEKDCEIRGAFKYCYKQNSLDLNDHKSSFDSAENQLPGVYLTIYDLYDTKDIKITKSMTPSKLHIGERGEITVTITNEGEIDAKNLRSVDIIPEGLRFISSSGVDTRIGNELWSLYYLPADKSVSYKYTVEMESFESVESKTRITYEYDEGVVLDDSKILNVPITGFSASYKWSDNKIDVEDSVSFTIELTNEDEDSSNIDIEKLYVKFPLILQVVPVSNQIVSKGFNEFEVVDELEKERTNRYVFNVKPYYSGTYDAYSELTVGFDDVSYWDNHSETLTVGDNQLSAHLSIAPQVLRGGNEVIMFSYLENIADSTLFNIEGSLTSELFTQDFNLESLTPGEKYTINTNKNVLMPINEEEKTINFVINGTYESKTGEVGYFETTRQVIVKPATESVTVIRDFEKNLMRKGEENKVVVRVSNELGDALTDLVVKESFSRPVTIISGSTYEEINLQGRGSDQSSAQAYIYNFRIPNNFPEPILEVITEVSSKSKGYREIFVTPIVINLTEPVEIDVNPDTGEIDNNETDVDTDPDNEGGNGNGTKPTKEKGFWAKVGDFFKSLFKRRD